MIKVYDKSEYLIQGLYCDIISNTDLMLNVIEITNSAHHRLLYIGIDKQQKASKNF